MNRIILFTNIKGGVGKTSTCALFAQYLYESGYPVMTLDADIQASLSRHRERELAANPDVAVPWDVSTIDTTDRQSLQSSIEEAKKFEGIVLVDMPGTLNASRSALPLAIARTSICCIRLRIWQWFLSPTTSTPSMPRVSSSRSSSESRIYGWYSCPTASTRQSMPAALPSTSTPSTIPTTRFVTTARSSSSLPPPRRTVTAIGTSPTR